MALEDAAVFLEDAHHEGDPVEFLLEIGARDHLQGQGQLSLGCPLVHPLLKRCPVAESDQG